MMISCKVATELIEKSQEQRLSRLQRFRLWVHTLLCGACKQYEKQSQQIEAFLKTTFDASTDPSELNVDTRELQQRIKEDLKM